MFENLSERTKKIIVNSMVLAGIVLFVLAIFYGNDIEGGHQKQTNDNHSKKIDDRETVYHYSPTVDNKTPNDESSTPVNPQEGGKNEDGHTPITMKDLFTEEALTKSKKVAVQFAKAFNRYDREHYLKNVKDSKKYMTPKLYRMVYHTYPMEPAGDTKKQTSERVKVTVPNVPDSLKPLKHIIWKVEVFGHETDLEGNKQGSVDTYFVLMKKVGGDYKIKNFAVNEPAYLSGNRGTPGVNHK